MQNEPKTQNRYVTAAALAVCLLTVAASLLYRKGRPEQLIAFEHNAPPYSAIYAGNLYRFAGITGGSQPVTNGTNAGDMRIVSSPVMGGTERTVITYEKNLDLESSDLLSITDAGIFFGLVPRISMKAGVGGGHGAVGIGTAGPQRFLGSFSAQNTDTPQPEIRSEKLSKHVYKNTYKKAADRRFLIRTAALSGGATRDICELHGSKAVLFAAHAIVIEPIQSHYFVTQINRGIDYWYETTQREDVVWADLTTGNQVRICSRSSYSQDATGDSGLLWSEPRNFPDSAKDLHYARASDGKVFDLGSIGASEYIGWSAECNQSLYWFVTESQLPGSSRLMASNLGSGASTILFQLTASDRIPAREKNLINWHGAMYCLLSDRPGTLAAKAGVYVAQIRPGISNRLEELFKLPATTKSLGMDSGFLYYLVTEQRPSLMERLTIDEAHGPVCETLMRVRLPD